MEAGERINKDETYKMPLTVFDVIRNQKLGGVCSKENQVSVNAIQKEEERYKEFFFPLNDLF